MEHGPLTKEQQARNKIYFALASAITGAMFYYKYSGEAGGFCVAFPFFFVVGLVVYAIIPKPPNKPS